MIIKRQRERIFVDVALLLCVFLLPSYLSLLLSSLFLIRYPKYFEFPVVALLVDVLYKPYGYTTIGLFGFALIILFIAEYLRESVKMKGRDTL